MSPLLEVRNLRVEFPGRRGRLVALDDISFDIAPGEILGVVGESGAGKSLTGAAIIGLLDPPGRIGAGEIRFDGRRIDNLPYEQMRKVRGRSIGAIFQDPLTSLDPLYTIGRQLIETIQTHLPVGAAEARRRAIRLLQETGIPAAEERIDQYPHQFSGGMRQRVVIALALAGEPQADRRRRADDRARRVDPGADHFAAQAPVQGARRGGDAGHARHGRDRRDLRPRRGDVRRPHRRDRPGRTRSSIRPRIRTRVGLMGSIPAMDEDRERLLQIDGAMPRLNAIPPGCAFNPRCPRAFDRCHVERPELMAAGATRAACWLHAPPLRAAA